MSRCLCFKSLPSECDSWLFFRQSNLITTWMFNVFNCGQLMVGRKVSSVGSWSFNLLPTVMIFAVPAPPTSTVYWLPIDATPPTAYITLCLYLICFLPHDYHLCMISAWTKSFSDSGFEHCCVYLGTDYFLMFIEFTLPALPALLPTCADSLIFDYWIVDF